MTSGGGLMRNLAAMLIVLGFAISLSITAVRDRKLPEPVAHAPAPSEIPPASTSDKVFPSLSMSDEAPRPVPPAENSPMSASVLDMVTPCRVIEDVPPTPFELPEETPHEGKMIDVPYVVNPPDIIRVNVLEALPGRPITGDRLVHPDGTISLGYYGVVHVRGLTTSQIEMKLFLHLRKFIRDETLGLTAMNLGPDEQPPAFLKNEGFPDLPPSDLFRDDLTKKVGPNGVLPPTKTESIPKRSAFVQPTAHSEDRIGSRVVLLQPEGSGTVSVEVSMHNSCVYYIQGEVQKPGRVSYTGHETVLDAVQYAGGLSADADVNTLRILRPAWGKKPSQNLAINWDAVLNHADKSANLQILPGDRLVVDRKK